MSKVDFSEIKIFEGKTFDSLLKEIHTNSKSKDIQIQELIGDLTKLVKTPGDANLLVPLISDYLTASIRNDDQLVKLATVIQRFLKTDSKPIDSTGGLTLKEREELFEEVSDSKVIKMDSK